MKDWVWVDDIRGVGLWVDDENEEWGWVDNVKDGWMDGVKCNLRRACIFCSDDAMIQVYWNLWVDTWVKIAPNGKLTVHNLLIVHNKMSDYQRTWNRIESKYYIPDEIMARWYHGLMKIMVWWKLWPDDIMARWYHGLIISWPDDIMVRWYHGPMKLWPNDIMVRWYHGLMKIMAW